MENISLFQMVQLSALASSKSMDLTLVRCVGCIKESIFVLRMFMIYMSNLTTASCSEENGNARTKCSKLGRQDVSRSIIMTCADLTWLMLSCKAVLKLMMNGYVQLL